MPIPPLNVGGLLPAGIHDCTVEEVRERFCRFQRSDRRFRLFEKLEVYLREVRLTSLVAWLVIDGSFVTAKEEPGDIDLIIVLKSDHDYTAQLRPFEYSVISKKRVQKRHAFDILVAAEGTPELDRYLDFFQDVKGQPGVRKGILKVQP